MPDACHWNCSWEEVRRATLLATRAHVWATELDHWLICCPSRFSATPRFWKSDTPTGKSRSIRRARIMPTITPLTSKHCRLRHRAAGIKRLASLLDSINPRGGDNSPPAFLVQTCGIAKRESSRSNGRRHGSRKLQITRISFQDPKIFGVYLS